MVWAGLLLGDARGRGTTGYTLSVLKMKDTVTTSSRGLPPRQTGFLHLFLYRGVTALRPPLVLHVPLHDSGANAWDMPVSPKPDGSWVLGKVSAGIYLSSSTLKLVDPPTPC